MNNPRETGIVHLKDLPEKEVYLDLNKEYKEEFLNLAKKCAGGTWNSLARKIKIPISKYYDSSIRCFKRGKLASLFLVGKISSFLVREGYTKFSLFNLEKNILYLSVRSSKHKISNPKFPFNFNTKEGATIISIMFHDGGITVRDLEPFYSNISLELKSKIKNSVKDLVGEITYWERYQEISFPKILGLILTCIGLIPGKRQINNPKFPSFVFNYDEELILEFLSQAIADDGWIYNPKKGFGFIGFNFTIDLTKFSKDKRQEIRKNKILKYLPNNLLGNLFLFKKIGCEVSGPHFGNEKLYFREGKEFRYTQEWRIQVRGHNNFQYLSKNLKIPLKCKQDKLLDEASKERIRKV